MKSHYKTARDLIDATDVPVSDLPSHIAMVQVYATLAVADAIAELSLNVSEVGGALSAMNAQRS